MLDRMYIESRINELTEEIKEKERWLRYAKERLVIESLHEDILNLEIQRDIYLMLL